MLPSPPDRTRVFVIAEAGVNHDGVLSRALALVEAAVAAGADAVKFQSFRADALVTEAAPKAPYQRRSGSADERQRAMLQRLELDADDHVALVRHCVAAGIEFMSSPFDLESLRLLVDRCGVRRIKLGSGELTHGALLLAAARTALPLVVSTGMATLAEVEEALGWLAFGALEPHAVPTSAACRAAWQSAEGRAAIAGRVTLLHCTTAYPTAVKDVDLRAMDTLRDAFGLPVGYSDHTIGCAVPWAAVARGATMLEKHITLDRAADGPDHAASADPDEFRTLVAGIRDIEAALGSAEKRPRAAELPQREVARRSLVAARPLAAGTVLAYTDLVAKRPAGGMSPMRVGDLVGRTLVRDLAADELVTEDVLAAYGAGERRVG